MAIDSSSTSIEDILNYGRWQALLYRSLETNLTNTSKGINHLIIKHSFNYPYSIRTYKHLDLTSASHIFEAWDNYYCVYSVIININPLITTSAPIVRIGSNPTRRHSSLVTVSWWKIPEIAPGDLEDTLLFDSLDTSRSVQPIYHISDALDEFFLINKEENRNPSLRLPLLRPPHYQCIPYIGFSPSFSLLDTHNQYLQLLPHITNPPELSH